MSRYTNDLDAVGDMLNNTVLQIISSVITVVGTLGLMLYTNVWLTIVTVVMVPLMMKVGGAVAGKSRKFYQAQQAAIGTLNGYIEETMTGQKVVKVFCHENVAEEEFEYLNDDLRGKQIFAQFWRNHGTGHGQLKPGQLFPDCDDRWYIMRAAGL